MQVNERMPRLTYESRRERSRHLEVKMCFEEGPYQTEMAKPAKDDQKAVMPC